MLLLLAGLCLVGTFLGAPRAKAMFNAPPAAVLWGSLAILLAAGFFVRKGMFRSLGLSAAHLGALLILVGAMWGSQTAHTWRAKLLSRDKPPSIEMLLPVCDAGSTPLPFRLRLRRAWWEFYPPASPEWSLLGVTYDDAEQVCAVEELSGREGQERSFRAINGTVAVLEYDPVHRAMLLAVSRDGRTFTNRLQAGPETYAVALPLTELFATPEAWRAASQPAILLAPPAQAVRDYKADVAAEDAEGNLLAWTILEINRPLHVGGYHVYLTELDPTGLAVVLRAVSDDGLYCVYAGFVLLFGGILLRLWGRPILRVIRAEKGARP